MRILYCHGYQRQQPSAGPAREYGSGVLDHLRRDGHEVVAPALPNDSFEESVRRVRERAARQGPFDAVIGSSRGGAVALAAAVAAPLVLRAPAWHVFGPPHVPIVPPGTIVVHGTEDDVIPPRDTQRLADRNPGLRVVWAEGGHTLAGAQLDALRNVLRDLPLVRPVSWEKFDIVADVHARVDSLEALLRLLGHEEDGAAGARRLVFLGDLVNARPYHPPGGRRDSAAVVERVRRLVEAGAAHCLLGNHELSLLLGKRHPGNYWFFGDEEPADSPCRPLGDPRADTATRSRLLHFLRRLPLALEWTGGAPPLRLVHACWHEEMIDRVRHETDAVRLHDREGARLKSVLWEKLQAERLVRTGESRVCHRDREEFLSKPEQRLLRQNGNPVKVLTSGVKEEWPSSADRVRFGPWWRSYDPGAPLCVVGHYGRPVVEGESGPFELFAGTLPFVPLGPGARVLCLDYQGRLAALRWPEAEVVFDNGRREPIEGLARP